MIKTFSCGLLDSNTYIVYSEGEAMIIDCGVELGAVADFVHEQNLSVKYIVLTHGHYDHVIHIGKYLDEFSGARAVCHADEVKVLTDAEANVSSMFPEPSTYNYDYMLVSEGDSLKVGALEFSVLHTPGHTPGGICLLCESEKILFTGDTLFHRGFGRTDFKYGSWRDIAISLRKLLKLDKEITFYAGHGNSAKLSEQR